MADYRIQLGFLFACVNRAAETSETGESFSTVLRVAREKAPFSEKERDGDGGEP